MAGFDAGHVVNPLDYDFRPFEKAKGVIKEPTDDQITEFLSGMKKVFDDVKGDLPEGAVPDDPVAMLAAMDGLEPDIIKKALGQMSQVYAELCSGKPSAAEIQALPLRIRSKFFEWLAGEVMSPEAVPGAGTRPVSTLPHAAAG